MEIDKFVIDNLGFDKFEFDKIGLHGQKCLVSLESLLFGFFGSNHGMKILQGWDEWSTYMSECKL
jgi:hypothetical protein